MRTFVLVGTALGLGLLMTTAATAQVPNPQPPQNKVPPSVLRGADLNAGLNLSVRPAGRNRTALVVTAVVTNVGTGQSPPGRIATMRLVTRTGVQLLGTRTIPSLAPGRTFTFSAVLPRGVGNLQTDRFATLAISPGDSNPANDRASIRLDLTQ
jgi:hypothetical protein